MTLVDTSSWIHSLRPDGDRRVSTRVRTLLETGEAAWCALVQLELCNGARGARERRVIAERATSLPELALDGPVWSTAHDLARKARTRGHAVPATDLVIAACARRHGVGVECDDSHLELVLAL